MSHFSGSVVPMVDKGFIDLNPLWIGCHQSGPGFTISETRDYTFIHYIIAGKGTLRLGGKNYNLKQNQLFIVPEGAENSYTADTNDPWLIIWICFNGKLSSHFATLPSVITATSSISSVFTEMLDVVNFDSMREERLVEKLFKLYTELAPKATPSSNYVRETMDYIQLNLYSANLTVENIAKHLNLERSYLSRVFKETTGKTIKKYILEIRMNMAASQLQLGFSVQEVAQNLGYADPYIFSKAFKKHTGFSPQNYKKNL